MPRFIITRHSPHIHKAKQEEEQRLSNSRTFLAIAEKWKEKKQGEIEAKTLAKYWRSLELHVFPFIGEYPIAEDSPHACANPA